jgi:NAD(P)-dependent dehydrogenase (short-subunit alcohol dehydrogenase family)
MNDRITSPFGARTPAREVARGHDLTGKRMIVTGAASGIGVETARVLAEAGASVVMAVRDVAKAEEIAAPVNAALGGQRMIARSLDLSNARSIAEFAAGELETGEPVHVLINNAGVMASPLTRVGPGWEEQFGVNHLGHFLLTAMLLPALEAAANETHRPSRVVSLSSIGHRRSDVVFDDPNYERRPYDKWEAYGQAKTANSLFAVGLSRKCAARGVLANAVMPGGILTPLQRHLTREEMLGFGWIDDAGNPNPGMKTPEQGASTSVWAAIGSELEAIGGLYLEDCAQAAPWSKDLPWSGVLDYALDPERADRLWTVSEELVGFRVD